ncbi:lytic murein transglycosylase B [Halomonas sp. PAMB 3264]|uniref:lytic murein transglycosylase B n=1 Tax=unclassified Halomonas TaxID=2609666 RepID=UPI00289E3D9B|nr:MULTISPECIES: lytic murein transglycosylase B [unclassified Halomonas]WNL37615.1 lytic murein transglycosylase B [Halomonas sp. PAMB 3232]WNL40929.1 lytic murein transglycosylase B [Halomonas sp. PAMB 3264]
MGRTRKSVGGIVLAVAMAGALPAWGEPESAFDPERHPATAELIDELSGQGIPRAWLDQALDEASFSQEVLDAMEGAAERRLEWHEYRDIFMSDERVEQGAAFISAHQEAFDRAEQRYGVPPEVIAAIIGVETYYGRYKGDHRVLDSLATLAFYHPSRGRFFRGELAAFLAITHEQEVAPESVLGSYAGAMGYPQFIPTSYQAYAVDFDGDGRRDLWENPVDAIGSVANYFAEHRWQAGAPIYHEAAGSEAAEQALSFNQTRAPSVTVREAAEAGLISDDELDPALDIVPLALKLADGQTRYGVGEYNFYVITRYNHSHLYAMAVVELAGAIADTLEGQQ